MAPSISPVLPGPSVQTRRCSLPFIHRPKPGGIDGSWASVAPPPSRWRQSRKRCPGVGRVGTCGLHQACSEEAARGKRPPHGPSTKNVRRPAGSAGPETLDQAVGPRRPSTNAGIMYSGPYARANRTEIAASFVEQPPPKTQRGVQRPGQSTGSARPDGRRNAPRTAGFNGRIEPELKGFAGRNVTQSGQDLAAISSGALHARLSTAFEVDRPATTRSSSP